jgi:hypothetical protein
MTHLSSEQISEWILGTRDPESERHLQTCSACHEDLGRFQEALFTFRQSIHDCAERPYNRMPHAGLIGPRMWKGAAIVALTSSIALLPLYLDVRQAQHDAADAQDSLLLDEVDQHLSRTVPQSMEQLMQLMNEEKEGLR